MTFVHLWRGKDYSNSPFSIAQSGAMKAEM